MLNYEKIIYGQRLKNVEEINLDKLNPSSDVINKLEKYSERYNFSFNDVLLEYQNSEIFRANFSKDPGKQSAHQKIAIEYIQNFELINKEKTLLLPSGGKNALYLISGQIIQGCNLTTNKKPKSIDFLIELINGQKIYCTHKYTKESGGSQDNQLNDVLSFLENSRNLHSKNIFVIAILDGDYYKHKINKINSKYQSKNCYSTNINNLLNVLEKINKSNSCI